MKDKELRKDFEYLKDSLDGVGLVYSSSGGASYDGKHLFTYIDKIKERLTMLENYLNVEVKETAVTKKLIKKPKAKPTS